MSTNEKQDSIYVQQHLEEIKALLMYAKGRFGFNFKEGYEKRLYRISYRSFIPNRKVINAIMKEWQIWESYVSPESFQTFFKTELENMFRCQTTSTFSITTLNQYIGCKATVISDLPYAMSTTIYTDGMLRMNGVEL